MDGWMAESNMAQLRNLKVNPELIVLFCCGLSQTPHIQHTQTSDVCCWISLELRRTFSCSN